MSLATGTRAGECPVGPHIHEEPLEGSDFALQSPLAALLERARAEARAGRG